MPSYLQKLCLRVFLAGSLPLAAITLRAQTMPTVVGELTALRQTTVNGEPAFAGLTLSNQTQIKTAAQGLALINMGQLGHFELQPNTDFTVLFSPHNIGGNLRKGEVKIHAPAKVALTVKLPYGQIVGEGKIAAAVHIEINDERTVIKSYQGQLKVFVGEQVHALPAGQTVWLNPEGQPQQSASNPVQSFSIDMQLASEIPSFIGLIRTSLYYSLHRLIDSFGAPSFLFETTLTCRDKNNRHCYVSGGVTP